MSRYFFDTDDGVRQVRDETGLDLASADDIASAARDLLCDLGFAELLNGKDRVFKAAVRDERGAVVYRASVSLNVMLDERRT